MLLKIIKSERVKLGLSQQEVARHHGVTTRWLSYIENNHRRSPKLEMELTEYYRRLHIERSESPCYQD